MTSVPRDPAFWRRFSMAVHLNEDMEKNSRGIAASPALSQRPTLKHTVTSDSWLEKEQKKRARRTLICWIFWLCFIGLIAVIVVVVLLLKAAHKI